MGFIYSVKSLFKEALEGTCQHLDFKFLGEQPKSLFTS